MSAPHYTVRHSAFDNTWSVWRGENEVVAGIVEESFAHTLADGLNARAAEEQQSLAAETPVLHGGDE